MSSLQIPNLSSHSQKRVHAYAAVNVPKLRRVRIALPKNPSSFTELVHDFNGSTQTIVPPEKYVMITTTSQTTFQDSCDTNKCRAIVQLNAILKTVAERVETHKNIGEQRKNWNYFLLKSINIMMLRFNTANIIHNNALKLSSIILLTSAKGMLLAMNKIQTSKQNATTLFKQLQTDIQTTLAVGNPTEEDVNSAMERVLALDKAYPSKFEPNDYQMKVFKTQKNTNNNGWSPQMEKEMREILEVAKINDREVYGGRGNLALNVSKTLAILGPLLTGIAALGSALASHGSSWTGTMAATAGSLAASANAFEHGGQVGMVFGIYRNCGDFVKLLLGKLLLETSIQVTLEEKGDCIKRDNSETFEMKVAMQLGRRVKIDLMIDV